jgi:multiple sugar transport system permease protein
MIGSSPAMAPTRLREQPSRLRRREALYGYLFILPNTVGLIVFFILPVLAAFVLGFVSWDLVRPPQWVGLSNYITLVHDSLFWNGVAVTIYYTLVSVPISIALSLLLAVAVNSGLRERNLYRIAYFMPYVSMPVALALVWKWIYDPQFGLLDSLLGAIGLPQPPWLNDPSWAMPALIIMAVWGSLGYNMIVFLAGLQGISQELYEAASIDGAGAMARFWRITVPLISPATFFVLIISMINSFQVFDQVYIMTQGGPGDATRVLGLLIYENAFQYFKMGYATAIAWSLFALILVVTLFQIFGQKRWVHYES